MTGAERKATREGVLYGLAAYGLWGVVPLYFRALKRVPPLEVLAHRIVWSVLFLAVILTLWSRWKELGRCLRSWPAAPLLGVTAILVALNWLTYIHSVSTNQVVQSSLGYFMTPLVNILLGLVFLRERLRPWQWCAVGLAAGGVAYLVYRGDRFPWIALTLAFSFGCYGLLRKKTGVDGLIGLSVETLFLLPAALTYLIWLSVSGGIHLGTVDRTLDGLILVSGVVTAIPLLCFGQAARRLKLATLGFLQYLSPSLQLLLAVTVMGEEFNRDLFVCFGCTWVALVIFSIDSLRAYRRSLAVEPMLPE